MLQSKLIQSSGSSYMNTLFVFAALFFGLALPVGTSVINIALGLLLICLFIKRDTSQIKRLIRQPLIFLPGLIFLLLALSCFITQNPHKLVMLSKYRKLLYILPLALFFLHDRKLIKSFFTGFEAANFSILLVSLFVGFTQMPLFEIRPDNPTVFRLHITQNFFMSLAATLWLAKSYCNSGKMRLFYAVLTALACYNILFMVDGRTGYISLICSFAVWLFFTLKTKLRVIACLGAIIALFVLIAVPSPPQKRIMQGINEVQIYLNADESEKNKTSMESMSRRAALIYKSWEMFKEAPVFGSGIGSFAYKNELERSGAWSNPHNEYLLQAVQLGLTGFAIFLAWTLYAYRIAWQQQVMVRTLFLALLSAYAIGNLFNSFLIDFAEGHFYVTLIAILAAFSVNSRHADLFNL